jgi:hypothetical protein
MSSREPRSAAPKQTNPLIGAVARRQPIEPMRQAQIVGGTLVLTGAALGLLVSPAFIALCALVGAGLLHAGLSGTCGMARLLSLLPWNRQAASPPPVKA